VAAGALPLFVFIQIELPWALGPPDGRYLLRAEPDGEPERVVVLGALTADGKPLDRRNAHGPGPLRRRIASSRRPSVPAEPEPAPVTTARATVIDPISLSAERQAQAWLAELDVEQAVFAAVAVLNRVLHAQRIAAAEPYARAVSPAAALTIRAGWGEGEQVADGRWLHAVQLPWTQDRTRVRRRAAALRADERLVRLLGARDSELLCEELTLRARLDRDQGRLAHAAIELDRAYTTALLELAGEQHGDLPLRVDELQSLQAGVAAAARAALPGAGSAEPDAETIDHALGRLEAALRARAAAALSHS
jgi:hypothetical protein